MRGVFLVAIAFGVTPAFGGDVKLIRQPSSFPIEITEPGSYRLKSDIRVPDEKTTAIAVTADHVTIDLKSYSISGPVVCTGIPPTCSPSGGFGAGVAGMGNNQFSLTTTVRNGSIHGMGGDGISIAGRADNVSADGNGGDGIDAAGAVTSSTARSNHGSQIVAPGIAGHNVCGTTPCP